MTDPRKPYAVILRNDVSYTSFNIESPCNISDILSIGYLIDGKLQPITSNYTQHMCIVDTTVGSIVRTIRMLDETDERIDIEYFPSLRTDEQYNLRYSWHVDVGFDIIPSADIRTRTYFLHGRINESIDLNTIYPVLTHAHLNCIPNDPSNVCDVKVSLSTTLTHLTVTCTPDMLVTIPNLSTSNNLMCLICTHSVIVNIDDIPHTIKAIAFRLYDTSRNSYSQFLSDLNSSVLYPNLRYVELVIYDIIRKLEFVTCRFKYGDIYHVISFTQTPDENHDLVGTITVTDQSGITPPRSYVSIEDMLLHSTPVRIAFKLFEITTPIHVTIPCLLVSLQQKKSVSILTDTYDEEIWFKRSCLALCRSS